MGEVFLGRDPLLGREVAVKVIQADSAFGEDSRTRFAREAMAAARLSHPNVITVYEFGEDDGLLFLVMEYLEGDDLDTLIQKGDCPRAELLDLLAQVCRGLGCAHDRGLVHRDVKPANILVTRHGHRATAKLMDFGIAQMAGVNLTQDGILMGTISYMAPEYLDTGKASPSSDLFSLGVILYEILSGGRKPFVGDSPTTILNRILRNPPAPLQLLDLAGLPPAMLQVAERALAKDPLHRFPTADALGDAILAALQGPPDLPGPAPGPASRPASPGAQATDLSVGRGGTGQFLSLRVALRHAAPGARIRVLPGLYRESLVLDQDVQIVAEGGPGETVLESGQGPCLTVRAGSARVEGVELRMDPGSPHPALRVSGGSPVLENCGINGGGGPAAWIEGTGTQARLRDCRIASSGELGLVQAEGSHLFLENSSLIGFLRSGWRVGPECRAHASQLRVGPAVGAGIWVEARAQLFAEDVEISGCEGGGVEVEAGGSAELRRSRLVGSRFAGLLALPRSRASLEECELGGHGCAGLHAQSDASLVVLRCRIAGNEGFGISLAGGALATVDGSEIQGNGAAGLSVPGGATAQVRNSRFSEGQSHGVACGPGGQAALEGCEIHGNSGVGARVEPGGNLLLSRCVLRDGRDSGLLLLEDSRATLEECVLHRNARGGILLAKDASDPEFRGKNSIEDDLFRMREDGTRVKVAPLRKH